jgi:histidine triad (HIT) family protein
VTSERTPAPQCAFCRIVDGSESQPSVLDAEEVLAFMDLRQPSGGHVLVIPKQHIENIFALDRQTGSALMAAITEVARAVSSAFRPDGVSVWQSNGPGAHQEVPHIHFHIMPRFNGDGLLRVYGDPPVHPDAKELAAQASRIRAVM